MSSHRLSLAVAAVLLAPVAQAHPSRSIAVRDDGVVIVPDAVRSVIWQVNPDGAVMALARGVHAHWLVAGQDGEVCAEHVTYDESDGTFSQSLVTISKRGERTTVVAPARGAAAFGAFVVRPDGAVLHAPEAGMGRVLIRTPDGETTTLVESTAAMPFENVAAMAQGVQSDLVFTDMHGVFEVDASGRVSRRLEKLAPPSEPVKEAPPADAGEIWGLAVDDAGGIYVTEPYTRLVLKISDKSEVSKVFTSNAPWFPTGLAWSDGKLYVVEHGLEGEKNLGPRILVLEPGGAVRVIATISE